MSLAAALAVVAIGGGAVLSQTGTGRTAPDPATPPTSAASAAPGPSVSPTPVARTLTKSNLITVSDLPRPDGDGQIQEWTENERPTNRVSVCQQPLATLGATAMLTRNFTVFYPSARLPDGPLANAPSIYTQALQFANLKSAEQALQTYRGWVTNCRATIKRSSTYEVISEDDKTTWIKVRLGDGSMGGFAQVPLYRDQTDTSGDGYFETVGLTLVEDRLMVTVEIVYGNEKHTSYQQGGDPDTGIPEDVQFQLVEAAAKRLTR